MSNQLKKTLKMPDPKAPANTIQTTVGELIGMEAALKKLAGSPSLVGVANYHTGLFLNRMSASFQNALAARNSVFQKYGKELPPCEVCKTPPGVTKIPMEHQADAQKELLPLLATEARVETDKLPLSFCIAAGLNAGEMAALASFIEESE